MSVWIWRKNWDKAVEFWCSRMLIKWRKSAIIEKQTLELLYNRKIKEKSLAFHGWAKVRETTMRQHKNDCKLRLMNLEMHFNWWLFYACLSNPLRSNLSNNISQF